MQPTALPDVIGGGANVALTTGPTRARYVILTALGGNARLGQSATAAAGAALIQNVPTVLYADQADMTNQIELANVNIFIPNGTTLTASYG